MHGGLFHVMKRFAFLLLFAAVARAADAPANVVKYRQSVMKAMGAHMTAMSLVVKKQVGDRSQLAAHASAIRDCATNLAAFFPRETAPDKTRTAAKAEIWQRMPEFRAAAERLRVESEKLAAAAKRGDMRAFDAQFANVGAACGKCHDSFRVKDSD
jgi:cytochrome c556